MESLRHRLRQVCASLMASVPDFRGKGRITLACDRCFTNPDDPGSYKVLGTLNGGYRFWFDLRPWGQKFAFYYRRWEWEHVEELHRLYSGGVFVDVGSSIGLYTVCLGDLVREHGARILSFEPISFNIVRQLVNLRENGLDSVVDILAVALGDHRDELPFFSDPTEADNNAFFAATGRDRIPVRTLDETLGELGRNDRIGLMKIDVEGYEPQVIDGARRTIERHKPLIFAEFCRERMAMNGTDMADTWGYLSSCGYECFRLVSGRLIRLADPADFEDLYFIPSGGGPGRVSEPRA